jgi:hypothetical protein
MIAHRSVCTKSLLSLMVVVAIACGVAQIAVAQFEKDDPVSAQKLKIAAAFCGTDGKLAECIGHPARECTELVKPIVDTCSAKPASKQFSPEDAFLRCFWGEYSKRYGKQIDRSEKCIKGNPDKSPLQPQPPHLAKLYKPLNPQKSAEESANNSAVALFPEDTEH